MTVHVPIEEKAVRVGTLERKIRMPSPAVSFCECERVLLDIDIDAIADK